MFARVRHHGPFTAEEIQDWISHGNLDVDSHVWNSDMTDWQALTEVDEFNVFAKTAPKFVGCILEGGDLSPDEERRRTLEVEDVKWMNELLKAAVQSDATNRTSDATRIKSETPIGVRSQPDSAAQLESNDANSSGVAVETKSRLRSLKLVSFIAMSLIAVVASLVVLRHQTRIQLPDVAISELEEIQLSTRAELEKVGVRGALAISKSSTDAPIFYVGTNLPQRSRLVLVITSLPGRLVEGIRVAVRVPVEIGEDGLAKSPPLLRENGLKVTKGEYLVEARRADAAGKGEVIARKTFFIGGAPDEAFDTAVERNLNVMREQARAELVEILQLTETLEQQLNQTVDQFEKLYAVSQTPAGIERWEVFHDGWSEMQLQLASMFAQWTPDFMENELFYSSTYALLKEAGGLVDRIHLDQSQAISQASRGETRQQPVQSRAANVSNISIARSALVAIRAKVALLDSLPARSNGLPPSGEP